MLQVDHETLTMLEMAKALRGLTNDQLGKELGVTGVTVGRWLNGTTKKMQSVAWRKLFELSGATREDCEARIRARLRGLLEHWEQPDAVLTSLDTAIVLTTDEFAKLQERAGPGTQVEPRGKVTWETQESGSDANAPTRVVTERGPLRDGDSIEVKADSRSITGQLRVLHVIVQRA
jgi:hypothetical protein